MNQQKSKTLHLSPGFALKETTAGLGKAVSSFLDRLLGKSAPAERPALGLVPSADGLALQQLPAEIACVTEQEAVALCQEMTARGYTAQVQFNDYDYSWSVDVSPAVRGA